MLLCHFPHCYSLCVHLIACAATFPNCLIVKFADDTTCAGLIRSSELDYRSQVSALISWCLANDLELNVNKTKEIILDFRKTKPTNIDPLLINGSEVETINHFKFLGIQISANLQWEINVDQTVSRTQQRLYFLRHLRSFGVSQALMVKFYRVVTDSVVTFSFTIWYNGATAEDRNRLARVVRVASRIVGCELPTLDACTELELWRKPSLSCPTLATGHMNCLRCCHRAEDWELWNQTLNAPLIVSIPLLYAPWMIPSLHVFQWHIGIFSAILTLFYPTDPFKFYCVYLMYIHMTIT